MYTYYKLLHYFWLNLNKNIDLTLLHIKLAQLFYVNIK